MNPLDTLIADYTETTKQYQEKLKAGLREAFTEFFSANPEFRSVEWTQYTPYFNDGDTCDFGIGEFCYTAQPEFYTDEHERQEIEDGDYSIWDLDGRTPFARPTNYQRSSAYHAEMVRAFDALPGEERVNRDRLGGAWEAFSATLASIPNEIYLAAFGDHVQVKVTADGMDIAEYEHD